MKKIIILIMLLVGTSLVFGETIEINKAKQVVQNLISERKLNNVDYEIQSHEVIQYEDVNTIFLFHLSPIGFTLISADNNSIPVIAYSFESEFELNNIPIQLQRVLVDYQISIKDAIDNNIIATETIESLWTHYSSPEFNPRDDVRNVPALIQARFNQPNPWNALCPVDAAGPGGRALVGCVAVSMAQVMHYWSYPEYGAGSHGYYHSDYGYLSANFGETFYDFDDMPNSTATLASQTLSYHAGVAVDMGYGADGSGAWVGWGNPCAMTALEEHFLYKSTINFKEKDNYSSSTWTDLMLAELDNGRPVIYRGYDNSGGHAWNIDGYQGSQFHCNWGWGGSANGYFSLDYLNGGGYNFSQGQAAIMGIEPMSLEDPNLIFTGAITVESQGDGDGIVNPGENAEIVVNIQNLMPWPEAHEVNVNLATEHEEIIIVNEFAYSETIESGATFTNTETPFAIEISNNATLGEYDFILIVSSTANDGSSYQQIFEFNIDVSLNQLNFPISVNNQIWSAPIIMDIDQDNSAKEIIFGDYGGFVHLLDVNGNERTGWPVDLEDQIWGAPAIADIDNDGELEIVVTSKNKLLVVLSPNGQVKMTYDSEQFLMGTPVITNIDDDVELEIIFAGYMTSGKIFAINHDGTDVDGFPLQIDERMMKGVATADFNSNGKDDIVVGTDNGNVYLILDDGSVADGFPFYTDDKIRVAPSILELNQVDENGFDKIIMVGSKDDNFYAINSDASERFRIETNGAVQSSASFIDIDGMGPITFFGSDDGFLYAVKSNGETVFNWPIYIGGDIDVQPVFSDLDSDGISEVIIANDLGKIFVFQIDGTPFYQPYFCTIAPAKTAPLISDIDNDGDLEIIIGTSSELIGVDIKDNASTSEAWTIYRGNALRTGHFESDELVQLSINDGLEIVNYNLSSAYPNPFNPTTTIGYQLRINSDVSLEIYNINGQLVETLINQQIVAGYHEVVWDAKESPSGLYFAKLQAGEFIQSQKLVLLK
jgi:hypothetical protein